MQAMVVGARYPRKEIHRQVNGKGNRQKGIVNCVGEPYVLVFKSIRGASIYPDKREPDGTILYLGEGRSGDQKMSGGNVALRDHLALAKELHVFHEVSKGRYEYEGQYICKGYHEETMPGEDKKPRRAFIFHLVPFGLVRIDPQTPIPPELSTLSEAELYIRAKAKASPTAKLRATTTVSRERAEAVKAYALAWANGICQGCKSPAPFTDKAGKPFLEVHHVHFLSDGGPDDPDWVIALCPNCHRRVHQGKDGSAFNSDLILRLGARQPPGPLLNHPQA